MERDAHKWQNAWLLFRGKGDPGTRMMTGSLIYIPSTDEWTASLHVGNHMHGDCYLLQYYEDDTFVSLDPEEERILNRLYGGLAVIQDYEHGLCPDCNELIPADALIGESCNHCGHAWNQVRRNDDQS
ncbi:hypothetical protein CMI47_10205 [Candidatus Pacearchaeota archaeon]|nr:hypothetical protein [Candidatus Pacearchaeota archaeon]